MVMNMRRLNFTDAAWLALESPDMPMHVGALLEFSPPEGADPNYLRDWDASLRKDFSFPQPWNLVPVSAPVLGALPVLREATDIDLAHHVRRWGLPSPGGQRELGILVARLHTQQLDMRRPLWEIHIIEGLEGNRFAAFPKLHHSIIDGASAMRLIGRALSDDPDDRDTPHLFEVPTGSGLRAVNPEALRATNPFEALLSAGRGPVESLRGVSEAGVGLVRGLIADRHVPRPFGTTKTLLNGRITGQRRLATQQYDMALIKRLAKAADATVNDIVLYLSSTAARRYLSENDVLPKQSLTAGIPVNVRQEGDERAGTVVGLMVAEVGTDVADPLQRLHAIKSSTTAAKQRLDSMSADAVISYGVMLAGPYMLGLMTGLAERAPASQSFPVSNVVGPRNPLYWNGSRLDAMYPMNLLFHGNALSITCVSYAGTLNFGLTGARDNLPHMQQLATNMADALDELAALLL